MSFFGFVAKPARKSAVFLDCFDSVMTTPFVMGHTLNEIAEEIEITEW